MSELTVDDFLKHYGVKGMKWGVRNSENSNVSGKTSKPSYNEQRKARIEALNNREMKNITVTTKNGETVEMKETKYGKLTTKIAALSKKNFEGAMSYSNFEISAGGEKVGDASFSKKSKDELYLQWLGVDDHARGKGYGSACFDAAVKYGRSEGVKKITLEVPGNAPDARHIYEKHGFVVTREATAREKKKDPVWGGLTKMELDLTKARLKHSDTLDEESNELELAFEQTFAGFDTEVEAALFDRDVEHSNVDAFLAHYGVKGMKWGVRKDQHRSYSDKATSSTEGAIKRVGSTAAMTAYFAAGGKIKKQQKYTEEWYNKLEDGKEYIEKGDIMKRIVRGVDSRALAGNLYVSTLESDSEMYKGVIPAVQKKFAFGQKEYHSVYQVELEAKKRLAMPSQKVRVDTFIETIQTPVGRQWMKDNGYKDEITELNAKEQGLKAYKKFNKYAGDQSSALNNAYFNNVKKKGYDALIDDNDAGIWSKKPVILLNAQSNAKITNVRQLSADEINQAQRNVIKQRAFKDRSSLK